MKIAIIGYGKMGKEIESVVEEEKKHQIVLKIDKSNREELTIENLKKCDIAIEFSQPNVVEQNILMCFEADIPIVVGTTSWDWIKYKEITIQKNKSLFVSPNFSIGVNIFMKLNKYLNKLMSIDEKYNLNITEIHHTEKLDAPSGTAIKLAEDLININVNNYEDWTLEATNSKNIIPIKAKREENVPGTHIIEYSNNIDSIEIKHIANNRKGFAKGALRAAEFLIDKKGFYQMDDLLG